MASTYANSRGGRPVSRDQAMGDLLHSAYESTAEDLRYGIGLMVDADRRTTPIIAVRYENWPPGKLEVVRESFVDGLTVEHKIVDSETVDVYVATRRKISVQSTGGGHTHVMHAPAWDARLAAVDRRSFTVFDDRRRHGGGFLFVVTTGCRQFMSYVDDRNNHTMVGPIVDCQNPPPADNF